MDDYKIVKIIDDESLVINAGELKHIEVGQKFQIIGKRGEEVKDPDTGESLGTLDEIKGSVFADIVYPHMTIAKSPHEGYSGVILNAFNSGRETLNVDPAEITGGYNSDNPSPIQIGDIARPVN
ncbi:MAG: hypothetical protein ABF639_02625 [Lacticaseibacillus paracasei]|uniref:hypothetical protein n=1 Tax=Lacticaseibacillus paracasei TaxID=1597 RepID=UPI00345DF8D3